MAVGMAEGRMTPSLDCVASAMPPPASNRMSSRPPIASAARRSAVISRGINRCPG
jgi:hypothetical protein